MPGYQHIYIIGAPRSGTTWLQQLIGAHEKVASGAELSLFHGYLRPVINTWKREEKINASGKWRAGLPLLFSDEEKDGAIITFLRAVYQKIALSRPGCTHILDKHPGNTLEVSLIRKYIPGAKFIHIIRDGRQAARSLLRIHREMGNTFGSSTWDNACWQWGAYVREGIRFRGEPWYMEIKYEDLANGQGGEILHRVFEFCGLSSSTLMAADILGAHTKDKMIQASVSGVTHFNPAHIDREENSGGLSILEKYYFQQVNGKLLQQLGYVDTPGWWAKNAAERLTIPILHKLLIWAGYHPAMRR